MLVNQTVVTHPTWHCSCLHMANFPCQNDLRRSRSLHSTHQVEPCCPQCTYSQFRLSRMSCSRRRRLSFHRRTRLRNCGSSCRRRRSLCRRQEEEMCLRRKTSRPQSGKVYCTRRYCLYFHRRRVCTCKSRRKEEVRCTIH